MKKKREVREAGTGRDGYNPTTYMNKGREKMTKDRKMTARQMQTMQTIQT